MPAPEIELYATRSGTPALVAAPVLCAANNESKTTSIQPRFSAAICFRTRARVIFYASLRLAWSEKRLAGAEKHCRSPSTGLRTIGGVLISLRISVHAEALEAFRAFFQQPPV